MPDLLLAHLFEHLCGAGKVFPQALAKIGINAFVLFLQRNGKGKDFLLRQAIEVFQWQCLLFTWILSCRQRRVPLPTGLPSTICPRRIAFRTASLFATYLAARGPGTL